MWLRILAWESSLEYLGGSKSHHKCPCARGRRLSPQSRAQGDLKLVAEIGVMWPHLRECQQPPRAWRDRMSSSPEPLKRAWWTCGLRNPERIHFCGFKAGFVMSHQSRHRTLVPVVSPRHLGSVALLHLLLPRVQNSARDSHSNT